MAAHSSLSSTLSTSMLTIAPGAALRRALSCRSQHHAVAPPAAGRAQGRRRACAAVVCAADFPHATARATRAHLRPSVYRAAGSLAWCPRPCASFREIPVTTVRLSAVQRDSACVLQLGSASSRTPGCCPRRRGPHAPAPSCLPARTTPAQKNASRPAPAKTAFAWGNCGGVTATFSPRARPTYPLLARSPLLANAPTSESEAC